MNERIYLDWTEVGLILKERKLKCKNHMLVDWLICLETLSSSSKID